MNMTNKADKEKKPDINIKGKKILLHMCCGPCSVYPVNFLHKHDAVIMGYFYGHNIHPYTEYLKRRDAVAICSEKQGFDVIYEKGYNIENFLRNTAFRESQRCVFCYHDRLKSAAHIAKHGKFDFFTSTLLYSKFQKHEMIRSIGEALGKEVGVPFFYEDFRKGWKDGIEESKKMGLYRQQYCGCIYSEKQRYYKK